MGYQSKNNHRPFERASKSSHHHIINDPEVKSIIERIHKPSQSPEIPLSNLIVDFDPLQENPVEAIIAADGGYTEVNIDKEFPSRAIHFLQFGALFFKLEDLAQIDASAFIAPEDMAKLRNIERLKLALPTKNLCFKDETSLKGTILKAIFEFFSKNKLGEKDSLIDTLAWFIFHRYKRGKRNEDEKNYELTIDDVKIILKEEEMKSDYTFIHPETGGIIYLTDIFRLQELIDEETGGDGILGYLMNVIEHLIIIHLIRQFLRVDSNWLKKILFIKDGLISFGGQPARLHRPMKDLVNWLFDDYNILLVGLEKSGAFVDHAQEIQNKLEPGQAVVLTDDYIYRYIKPGGGDPDHPYAHTSNYGHKVIFKTRVGQMYVLSVPVRELKKSPTAEDLPNLQVILNNIESLHCDMYDSALFPVALVNKLVSLSAHPSQRILQKFANSGSVHQ
jgi:hypothetical protein